MPYLEMDFEIAAQSGQHLSLIDRDCQFKAHRYDPNEDMYWHYTYKWNKINNLKTSTTSGMFMHMHNSIAIGDEYYYTKNPGYQIITIN